MKAALYVRVSTEEQAKEGYSIAAQKQRLNEFAKSQGWEIYKVYVDEGFSAKNLERPKMQKMIDDIKKNKFEVVLVYRLDRLVRSVVDLHELLNLFEENNVMFKSATEMFDTTSAMGRFFITLVGAMAEWERENLGERIYMGMKRMAQEGKRAGGPTPYGYNLVEGKLEINPDEEKWVKYIFDNYKLKGARTIAIDLNTMGIKKNNGKQRWTDGTIKYVLRNPVYCGFNRWNNRNDDDTILTQGDHKPIISKELFDEIQDVIGSRKQSYKGNSSYPFSSKLKCARCGYPLQGKKKKRKDGTYYRYYQCNNRANLKLCDLPPIREYELNEVFFRSVDLIRPDHVPIEQEVDFEQIEKEISRIQKALENMKKLFMWGDMDEKEYRKESSELQKKESQLTHQLQSTSSNVDLEVIKDMLKNAKESWDYLTFEQQKAFIHDIITQMVVDKHEKVEIVDITVK